MKAKDKVCRIGAQVRTRLPYSYKAGNHNKYAAREGNLSLQAGKRNNLPPRLLVGTINCFNGVKLSNIIGQIN